MRQRVRLAMVLGLSFLANAVMAQNEAVPASQVRYKTQTVDGISVFYREAGSPQRPTLVLLHGFPSSSHMFRDLIPKLAGKYHLVAADMPGYGYTEQPPLDKFSYTFDAEATLIDHFLDSIGVKKYSIYIQDYGSPVGFKLLLKHPERIQTIISQSGNAYDEGLSTFWSDSIIPYWKDKNPTTEKKVLALFTPETTRFQYSKGFVHPELVSPDSYTFDQMTLDRPGNREIQLALMYDYQNNVKQYPQWHAALRNSKVPVLAVWGKNDPIFLPAGAEAFKKDVASVELHLLDTGHFALEDQSTAIANYILAFLGKNVH